MSQKKVLIPLAQGCEEIEAVTLIDLLVRAEIEVVTASLDDNRTITASRGVQLIAQTTLESVLKTPFDLVVLPGGLPGADHLNKDLRLHQLLKNVLVAGGYVGAICAAPKVLVSAGLLEGKQATSFPGVIDQHPAEGMTYLNEPVVVDGQIITSRGPGTAIAFALTLIEMLVGAPKRAEVQAALQI
ncbi:Putative cysteine protease YraA [Hydrogenovibrio crunogenus]|uniref:Cysteine protease YraA n=1 Tax=Hydrogenovibrio crunogenus TaxID=39765 RepID=A0A4P7P0Z3_9GAMM|nr:DJ-1 family glyoxalase III [Hydrogenovibrio crunogenus]QBZ83810.1 Putative cysteine protease YraA [Hydrogenovibrio crunogenus]RUM91235.1 MAG: DJ-1 family protein [Thiomicrospira sp.]